MARNKYLKDITVCADNGIAMGNDFNRSTNCVCAHLLSKLGKIETGGIGKIYIVCTASEKRLCLSCGQYEDIMEMRVLLDYKRYWDKDSDGRKIIILKLLYNLLKPVFINRKWNIDALENAYTQIIEDKYLYIFPFGKSRKSPNGKWIAKIFGIYEVDRIELWICARSDNDLIVAEKWITTMPHEIFISELRYNIKWSGLNTLDIEYKHNDVIKIHTMNVDTAKILDLRKASRFTW